MDKILGYSMIGGGLIGMITGKLKLGVFMTILLCLLWMTTVMFITYAVKMP